MEDEIIIRKMQKLSKLIDYEPTDITFLKKAMYRQVFHKPNDGHNRKNYKNDSYATLGDTLLKFILTDYLFDKGYDKAKITKERQSLEKNKTLYELCKENEIFKYAYNDNFFSPMLLPIKKFRIRNMIPI